MFDEVLGISPNLIEQYLALDVEVLTAMLGARMRSLTAVESANRAVENLFFRLFPSAVDTRSSRNDVRAKEFISEVQSKCCAKLCAHIDAISTLNETNAVLEIARVLVTADPLLLSRAPRAMVATVIYKIGLKEFCKCDNLQPKVQDYPF